MAELLLPDRTMGVFETLLILDGVPIELEAHLDRLGASVRELFESELPAGMRELVRCRARSLAAGRLRLTLAPGLDRELAADVVTAPIDRADVCPPWERAIVLAPYLVPGGLGQHKWADRAGLAASEARGCNGCLPLVLDAGEEVLEAARANVFAVEDGVLLTPPADGRILRGVARARTIATAGSLGVEVREEALDVERLIASREVFLTGSVRGIEPVRAIGESELRPPSAVVGELADALRREWLQIAAARSRR